jgi:hypothetical protein
LEVSDGAVKFRQNLSWTVNWGGSTFPSGTGILNGSNISTSAGTYDITFNILNGTYTFVASAALPSIGIWGPAVDSQNGYAGADIDMVTTDGIIYTLSGFFFSSGQAYFRQDNAMNFVWGSTSYPAGLAVLSGPSLFIPGGEHFVTFNRITGAYSFNFPSVGILGSALNGFNAADTDLNTDDGFTYTIDQLTLNSGEVKFRKDNSWTTNWGASSFPSGTGSQDGANIPVGLAGNYSVTFDRLSGQYNFFRLLGTEDFERYQIRIYPNPSSGIWNFSYSNENILSFELYDSASNKVASEIVNNLNFSFDASKMPNGLYFGKIETTSGSAFAKLIKL